MSAPQPSPAPGHGPGLRWGVRTSFLRYVANLHDGRASVSDGASMTLDDPQLVVFPLDPELTTAEVLAFRGDLRLAGHGGLLFLRLAQPRLELGVDEEPATLTVADPMTEDGSGPRLALVRLTLTRVADGWSGTDVRITEEGTSLFNQMYPAGEAFDPLHVTGVAGR